MKIIYNAITGTVVDKLGGMRYPGPDEKMAEGSFIPMTKPPYYYRYNGSFVVPRDEKEVLRELAEKNFNVEQFVGELNSQLTLDRVKALGSNIRTLEWTIIWNNWSQVYTLIVLLRSEGDVSAEEEALIKKCFSTQGINLDDYSPKNP